MCRSRLLFCLLIAFALVGWRTPAEPPTLTAEGDPVKRDTDAALAAKGEAIVTMLREGKNDEVWAMFDETVAALLPKAQLPAVWSQIEGLGGEYQEILLTRVEKKQGFDIVMVTVRFENMPLVFTLSFDSAGKIAGFTATPATDAAAFGPRPQLPKAPFPYDQREVTYKNPNDDSTIAGTLTYPKEKGPHPVVLLITGSGSQDRDESLLGHKPFLVIADHLSRNGVAVLRVDDRGIGGSDGDPQHATLETHATDVEAGVAFLKTQPEVDPKHIGLIGHSEGGILATIVASRSPDVAYFISLAGTGLPGSDIIPLQVEAMMRLDGSISDDGIKAIMAEQHKIVDLVLKDADKETITAAMRQALLVSNEHLPAEHKLSPAQIDATATQQTTAMTGAWMVSFFKTDPRVYWKKITTPALVMIGEKDFQVAAQPNIKAIKEVVGDSDRVRLEMLPGLNHLFQAAETGALSEYGKIEETVNPAALKMMTDWILFQTRP